MAVVLGWGQEDRAAQLPHSILYDQSSFGVERVSFLPKESDWALKRVTKLGEVAERKACEPCC
eukprot:4380736-Amphidinium_carterae.2